MMEYTECDEVAEGMRARGCPQFRTLGEATAYVRARMPDETQTVISNVAWRLHRNGYGEKAAVERDDGEREVMERDDGKMQAVAGAASELLALRLALSLIEAGADPREVVRVIRERDALGARALRALRQSPFALAEIAERTGIALGRLVELDGRACTPTPSEARAILRACTTQSEEAPSQDVEDSLGHTTRYSDSSLFDFICTKCGATDGGLRRGLEKPCPLRKGTSAPGAAGELSE